METCHCSSRRYVGGIDRFFTTHKECISDPFVDEANKEGVGHLKSYIIHFYWGRGGGFKKKTFFTDYIGMGHSRTKNK